MQAALVVTFTRTRPSHDRDMPVIARRTQSAGQSQQDFYVRVGEAEAHEQHHPTQIRSPQHRPHPWMLPLVPLIVRTRDHWRRNPTRWSPAGTAVHLDDGALVIGRDLLDRFFVHGQRHLESRGSHRRFDQRIVVRGPYLRHSQPSDEPVAPGGFGRRLSQRGQDMPLQGLAPTTRVVGDVLGDER